VGEEGSDGRKQWTPMSQVYLNSSTMFGSTLQPEVIPWPYQTGVLAYVIPTYVIPTRSSLIRVDRRGLWRSAEIRPDRS
jgi:hypothetical protein